MAHRRRKHRRRHARENPLSDTTKIVLAVGVTAAVVGVGYYMWKRQSAAALPSGAVPQLATTRGAPDPSTPAGSSQQTQQDASTTSNASLANNVPPAKLPPGCIPTATPPYYSCPPTAAEIAAKKAAAEASAIARVNSETMYSGYATPPQGLDQSGNY